MKDFIFRKAASLGDISGCKSVDAGMGFTTKDAIFSKVMEDGKLFIAELNLQIVGYLRYGYLWVMKFQ